jgi:hypothetical protein
MEDIELGRKARREETYVVAGPAAALALPPDPSRTALVIANAGPNVAFLGYKNSVANLVGMPIPVGSTPLTLTLHDHGRIVTDGFYAVTAAAQSANLAFWASYLEEGKR